MLSVIVPVYNGEKTVRKLLDSLLCEEITRGEIEVIVVNDGSKDNTIEILHAYTSYPIIIIDKENGGVSSARNEGMRRATGEYVYFADADDIVHIENMKELIVKAEKTRSDLIVYGYEMVSVDGKRLSFVPCEDEMQVVEKEELKKLLSNFLFGKVQYMSSLWNKLFKMDIIQKNDISFDEKRTHGEDWAFIIRYLQSCKRLVLSNRIVYDYIQDGTQTIEKYGSSVIFSWEDSVRLQKQLARHIDIGKGSNEYNRLMTKFWWEIIQTYSSSFYQKEDKRRMISSNEATAIIDYIARLDCKKLPDLGLSRKDKYCAQICKCGMPSLAFRFVGNR